MMVGNTYYPDEVVEKWRSVNEDFILKDINFAKNVSYYYMKYLLDRDGIEGCKHMQIGKHKFFLTEEE